MVQEMCNESAAKSSNIIAGSTCDVCKTKPSKYKCPGCLAKTCSLPCVKAHKQSTGCDGKRKLTQFIPLEEFDDNILLSDYNLLENAKRVAESAQRKRVKLCGDDSQSKLPSLLKSLAGAAASRRTTIRFVATGMSKRQINQSFYDYGKKVISWTIEWRFHSTDVVLHDHGVDDNTSLSSVIMNHLKPGPFNHPLKRFCEEPLQSLKFFIEKFPERSESPFIELDIEAPIREQLEDLVIVEYPVIYVYLPSHRNEYEVLKVAIRHKLDRKDSKKSREPSPKGVLLREEELKEDEKSMDPKVLDVMKHVKQDGIDQLSQQHIRTVKESTNMLESSSRAAISEQEGTKNDNFFDKYIDEDFIVKEDENFVDPKVLDVMKHVKQDGIDQLSQQHIRTVKESTNMLESSSRAAISEQEGTKNDNFFDKYIDEDFIVKEDENFVDPKVLDVMKHVKQDGIDQLSQQHIRAVKESTNMLESSSRAAISEQEGTKNDNLFDKDVDEQLDFIVIEDENSVDPKVLDVMKHVKQDGLDQLSQQHIRTVKESTDMLESSSRAAISEQEETKNDNFFDKDVDEQLDFIVNSTVAEIIEKMDPELVQELIGSCSDLMPESSLDDFFDLDGVFTEELGLVETNDLPTSCKVLPVEEPEEGEIVEELEEGEIVEELEEGEIPQ